MTGDATQATGKALTYSTSERFSADPNAIYTQPPPKVYNPLVHPPTVSLAEAPHDDRKCREEAIVNTYAGALATGAAFLVGHQLMKSSYPAHTISQMKPPMKFGLGVALTILGGYVVGEYSERRCRRAHGLPPL